MYLYLGGDTVVNTKTIVGIFDLDNTTISKITKEFLSQVQQGDCVITTTTDIPKSFVVCVDATKTTVYLSQISPSTLRKRNSIKKSLGSFGHDYL